MTYPNYFSIRPRILELETNREYVLPGVVFVSVHCEPPFDVTFGVREAWSETLTVLESPTLEWTLLGVEPFYIDFINVQSQVATTCTLIYNIQVSLSLQRDVQEATIQRISTFLDLVDTPDTYDNNHGKFVRVHPTKKALEFISWEFSPSDTFVSALANERISAGDFVHLQVEGNTTIAMRAIASDPTRIAHGFALDTVAANQSLRVQAYGLYTFATEELIPGETYYLSPDPSRPFVRTWDWSVGQCIQRIGYALDKTILFVSIGDPILVS
jgi:hypothetical protein